MYRKLWKTVIISSLIILLNAFDFLKIGINLSIAMERNAEKNAEPVIETKEENVESIIEEDDDEKIAKKEVTKELYKGYLYTRTKDTTFEEKDTIKIANKEAADSIELLNNQARFITDDNAFDITDYVMYKTTGVNQEEFNHILGAEGEITILDEEENVIGKLNHETLNIQYETEVKNIKIIMTNPIAEGELSIFHTKAIKPEQPYNKEELKTFQEIQLKTDIKNNTYEETIQANISLKDTKTEAELKISNNNLSTMQVNENIEFLVNLKSDSIEYDLYKNPIIKIIIPKELNVEVKNVAQLNKLEELRIVNATYYKTDSDETIIEMKLEGEQTQFENVINEGIQILITTNLTSDKTTPTKEVEIQMCCQNENRPEEEFKTVVPVTLNSKYGVLMVNTLSRL